MGFSFNATARCEQCGEYLSASDETCDHDGDEAYTFLFRRVAGDERVVEISATHSWRWHRLKREVGDDWIAYQSLGRKDVVETLFEDGSISSYNDLPTTSMSLRAPADVREYLSD